MNHRNLSQQETRLIEGLPATISDLSALLGVSESRCRDIIQNIRNKNFPIHVERDGRDYIYYTDTDDRYIPQANNTENQRLYDVSKGKQTRKTNDHLADIEQRINELLSESKPPRTERVKHPGNQDVVIHRTDDHIGDIIDNEFGEEVFNTEIAKKRIESVTEETVDIIKTKEKSGHCFDMCHLLLGGDIITNENVYDDQPHKIDRTLDEQIDIASELYFEQIKELASLFPAVQVVCQVGNHGEIRASGMSEKANADDIVYRFIDQLIRVSDLDNVELVRNDSTTYTNFEMRNWNGHLRHGQDSLEHIGTSAGKSRWRGWLCDHDFDIAYRGHYHTQGLDMVRQSPVIATGSIKPPDDFEDSLSESSRPSATIHGVSDENVLEWFIPIYFD